jgi:histidinol dehydrogenase
MTIGAVENHRSREGGAMVYPVYSRRSKGLSVGINLFPDAKLCSFDCPYCEVFPFKTDIRFSTEIMAKALEEVLAQAREKGEPVRDICFSGNGEPTISPYFPEALEAAARIRETLVPEAALVVITNGTGLLSEATFEFLRRAAAGPMGLSLWLKLDAGTGDWYAQIDRSAVPFDRLTARIREFAALAPFTIQTMICAINGAPPPAMEAAAWERLVLELAAAGQTAANATPGPRVLSNAAPAPGILPDTAGVHRPGIRAFQIYGKARPSPQDPLASRLPVSLLEERAGSLRIALEAAGLGGPEEGSIPVEVFP